MGIKGRLRHFFGLSPKKKHHGELSGKMAEVEVERESEPSSYRNDSHVETNKFGFSVINDNGHDDSSERAAYSIDVFHDAESCPVRQVCLSNATTSGNFLLTCIIFFNK